MAKFDTQQVTVQDVPQVTPQVPLRLPTETGAGFLAGVVSQAGRAIGRLGATLGQIAIDQHQADQDLRRAQSIREMKDIGRTAIEATEGVEHEKQVVALRREAEAKWAKVDADEADKVRIGAFFDARFDIRFAAVRKGRLTTDLGLERKKALEDGSEEARNEYGLLLTKMLDRKIVTPDEVERQIKNWSVDSILARIPKVADFSPERARGMLSTLQDLDSEQAVKKQQALVYIKSVENRKAGENTQAKDAWYQDMRTWEDKGTALSLDYFFKSPYTKRQAALLYDDHVRRTENQNTILRLSQTRADIIAKAQAKARQDHLQKGAPAVLARVRESIALNPGQWSVARIHSMADFDVGRDNVKSLTALFKSAKAGKLEPYKIHINMLERLTRTDALDVAKEPGIFVGDDRTQYQKVLAAARMKDQLMRFLQKDPQPSSEEAFAFVGTMIKSVVDTPDVELPLGEIHRVRIEDQFGEEHFRNLPFGAVVFDKYGVMYTFSVLTEDGKATVEKSGQRWALEIPSKDPKGKSFPVEVRAGEFREYEGRRFQMQLDAFGDASMVLQGAVK